VQNLVWTDSSFKGGYTLTNTKINAHFGSDFEDFLAEEGILEHCTAIAVKRILISQILEEMKVQKLSKKAVAAKMHISCASLNQLFDASDISITLTTLISVATALGKKVNISLV
jgi:predicted XRE-type DNA-binding protein